MDLNFQGSSQLKTPTPKSNEVFLNIKVCLSSTLESLLHGGGGGCGVGEGRIFEEISDQAGHLLSAGTRDKALMCSSHLLHSQAALYNLTKE